MAVELRALTPTGDDLEILPDWADLTFAQDLLDPGALTFSYPKRGRNYGLLSHGTQVALRLDENEPKNGRFYVNESAGSRIAESATADTFALSSSRQRFDSLRLGPGVGSTVTSDTDFAWTNLTPGAMMITAIASGMSRANPRASGSANPKAWFNHPIPSVASGGFTATTDSSGTAWPATYDATFQSGQSVNDVLAWLVERGFAEATMEGKNLRLYAPDNNGTDLTLGDNPVVLQTGADFTQASYAFTSRELVNALLVTGDNNACTWVFDDASIALNGYREGTLAVPNVVNNDNGTLTKAGQAWLTSRSKVRESKTYEVSALYLESNFYNTARPFIDYQVGDSVLILDGFDTTVQRLRLMSATYPTARSSAVQLTVNDWLGEFDVNLDRRLARLGA